MRVGFLDLAKSPVFYLENDQANILAVEQKIRFVSVDVRRVPAQVVRIRFGHSFEEFVESLFPPPVPNSSMSFGTEDVGSNLYGLLLKSLILNHLKT